MVDNNILKNIDRRFRNSSNPDMWDNYHTGLRNFYDQSSDYQIQSFISGNSKVALGRSNFKNIGEFRDAVINLEKDAEYTQYDPLYINNINQYPYYNMTQIQKKDTNDVNIEDDDFMKSQHKLETYYFNYREIKDQLALGLGGVGLVDLKEAEKNLVEEWQTYNHEYNQYWDKHDEFHEKQSREKEEVKVAEKPPVVEKVLSTEAPKKAVPRLNVKSLEKELEIRENPNYIAPSIYENKPSLKTRINKSIDNFKASKKTQEPAQPVLSSIQRKDVRTIDGIRNQLVDTGPNPIGNSSARTEFADRLHGYATNTSVLVSQKLGYTNEVALAYVKADTDYIKRCKDVRTGAEDKSNFWVRQLDNADRAKVDLFLNGRQSLESGTAPKKGIFEGLVDKVSEKLNLKKDDFDKELDGVMKDIFKDTKKSTFTDKALDKIKQFKEKVVELKNDVVNKAYGKPKALSGLEQRHSDAKKLEGRINNPNNSPARQAYYERLKDYTMAGSKTMPENNPDSIIKAQKVTMNDINILGEKMNAKGITPERKEYYGRLHDHASIALERINEREKEYLRATGYSSLSEASKEEKAKVEKATKDTVYQNNSSRVYQEQSKEKTTQPNVVVNNTVIQQSNTNDRFAEGVVVGAVAAGILNSGNKPQTIINEIHTTSDNPKIIKEKSEQATQINEVFPQQVPTKAEVENNISKLRAENNVSEKGLSNATILSKEEVESNISKLRKENDITEKSVEKTETLSKEEVKENINKIRESSNKTTDELCADLGLSDNNEKPKNDNNSSVLSNNEGGNSDSDNSSDSQSSNKSVSKEASKTDENLKEGEITEKLEKENDVKKELEVDQTTTQEIKEETSKVEEIDASKAVEEKTKSDEEISAKTSVENDHGDEAKDKVVESEIPKEEVVDTPTQEENKENETSVEKTNEEVTPTNEKTEELENQKIDEAIHQADTETPKDKVEEEKTEISSEKEQTTEELEADVKNEVEPIKGAEEVSSVEENMQELAKEEQQVEEASKAKESELPKEEVANTPTQEEYKEKEIEQVQGNADTVSNETQVNQEVPQNSGALEDGQKANDKEINNEAVTNCVENQTQEPKVETTTAEPTYQNTQEQVEANTNNVSANEQEVQQIQSEPAEVVNTNQAVENEPIASSEVTTTNENVVVNTPVETAPQENTVGEQGQSGSGDKEISEDLPPEALTSNIEDPSLTNSQEVAIEGEVAQATPIETTPKATEVETNITPVEMEVQTPISDNEIVMEEVTFNQNEPVKEEVVVEAPCETIEQKIEDPTPNVEPEVIEATEMQSGEVEVEQPAEEVELVEEQEVEVAVEEVEKAVEDTYQEPTMDTSEQRLAAQMEQEAQLRAQMESIQKEKEMQLQLSQNRGM